MDENKSEQKEENVQVTNIKMPGGNGHLPGKLKLDDIVYIGSHNTACSKAYGWVYAQQNVTITEQFEKYGSRFFKQPLHWFVEANNWARKLVTCFKCNQVRQPSIVCAHEGNGRANCRFTVMERGLKRPERAIDRLPELGQLANKYPNEMMILFIEQYLYGADRQCPLNGTSEMTLEEVAQSLDQLFTETGLKERAFNWKNYKCPTLEKARQSNKNLMIFIDNKTLVNDTLLHTYCFEGYKQIAQLDWVTDPLNNFFPKNKIERGYHHNNPWSIASNFLLAHYNPEASIRLDSTYRTLYNEYNTVKRRFDAIHNHYNKICNLISTDYVDQGDLARFVDDFHQQLIEKHQK